MGITEFNGTTLGAVRHALNEALKNVAEEFNIELSVGRIKYTDSSAEIQIDALAEGGESKMVLEYKLNQKSFALPDLYTQIDVRDEVYKTIGFKRKNRKYPVICERMSDGKNYKFPAPTIANAPHVRVITIKKPKLRKKKDK